MAVIYLDNNATTKPFPEVVDVMTQFMTSRYWNASSAYGQLDGLEEVVETAKAAIRALIGAAPDDDVVFTSGATESNAWAVAEGARRSSGHGWVLTSQIEHPSVREAFDSIQKQGVNVRWLPVTRDGVFDLDKLAAIVDSNLKFVSLMLAHNETGVIQPLHEAVSLIRKMAPQCLIHTDATQAIGKIPVSLVDDLDDVDLMSFSGHKFHGPKGIGCLVINNGIDIQPIIRGGGQQNNLRSGTLNVPAIMGIAKAANITHNFIENDKYDDIRRVREYFETRMLKSFSGVFILGSQSSRLPNTSFFGIPETDSDDIVYSLAAKGIALSNGSSCSTKSITPPLVATLMGYNHEEANSLLRLSLSYDNDNSDIERLIDVLDELL